MEYKRRHKEEMSDRGIRRDRNPIGDEVLRVGEPVTAVCIGRTSGGRRGVTVACGNEKEEASRKMRGRWRGRSRCREPWLLNLSG